MSESPASPSVVSSLDLLGEVSRLSDALRDAQALVGRRHRAVLAALEAGHSAKAVAAAAGISVQRVYAMTADEPPSTRRQRAPKAAPVPVVEAVDRWKPITF